MIESTDRRVRGGAASEGGAATVPTSMPRTTAPSNTTASGTWQEQVQQRSSVLATSAFAFLPDFTEHPKPKRRKTAVVPPPLDEPKQDVVTGGAAEESDGEVTFLQDFVAGGLAGSASVIVGHPLDTIKVRIQNSATSSSILSAVREFGGVSSLFRGMGAPLSAAAVINAIVFSTYGVGSKFYDSYIVDPDTYPEELNHDPWQKAMTCGSFAGLVQCAVICPMEHVKCRLQVQQGAGYKGPLQATRGIVQKYGLGRLYQGWWVTALREVPAFGLYFAIYDYTKDRVNSFLAKQAGVDPNVPSQFSMQHTHTWAASAIAGGLAGSCTWLVAYPVDVIKTKIQTSPLDMPRSQLSMWRVGSAIVAQHGVKHLFRGLGITLIRAFPVNGTIFPVYELTLLQLNKYNFR